MGIFIERDNRPSKLDEKLESLRNPDGDIWLAPQEARDLLFPGLWAFYKGQMAQLEEIGFPALPVNVEALAQIASLDSKNEHVNLIAVEAEIASKKRQIREEEIAREKASRNGPRREPPQAEL